MPWMRNVQVAIDLRHDERRVDPVEIAVRRGEGASRAPTDLTPGGSAGATADGVGNATASRAAEIPPSTGEPVPAQPHHGRRAREQARTAQEPPPGLRVGRLQRLRSRRAARRPDPQAHPGHRPLGRRPPSTRSRGVPSTRSTAGPATGGPPAGSGPPAGDVPAAGSGPGWTAGSGVGGCQGQGSSCQGPATKAQSTSPPSSLADQGGKRIGGVRAGPGERGDGTEAGERRDAHQPIDEPACGQHADPGGERRQQHRRADQQGDLVVPGRRRRWRTA